MASRFLALILLAGLLSPVEVGLYGLVLAAISYTSYALGLDFYTFSTRELIRAPADARRAILRGHASVLGLSYLVVVPLTLLLFAAALLPWWVAPWFMILLPLEHLGLELDRILVAAGDPLGASATVFMRQGLWPTAAAIVFWLSPESRTLTLVFLLWAMCAAVALACAVVLIRRQTRGGVPRGVDWRWVRRGVRVASLLLAGSLLLRVLFTTDRYVVAAVSDTGVLASYTLYMGLANALTLGIAAAVHQFQYPRLVAAAHSGLTASFNVTLRAMVIQTSVLCFCFVLVMFVFVRPLLYVMVGDTYVRELWMLPWVLAATVLFNLSMVPHFVLYARNRDGFLTGAAAMAVLAFVVSFAALPRSMGVTAVLVSLVVANGALLGVKTIAAQMSKPTRPAND